MSLNSKRIAQNTAFMYFRMALTILIGLFSVRVVLRALGTEDFGIYNVVGGVVTMLAFLNNALASSTQRFLSFELGKNNQKKMSEIFNNSLSLYIMVVMIIIIIAETLGLWLVNSNLVIPEDRLFSANCVYQFSIISFVFIILQSPYNAVIIARERMDVYAYVSIIESVLKLGMISSLLLLGGDKLILYGGFMMIISASTFVFYCVFCKAKFQESRFLFEINKEVLSEIGGFAGWGMWGAISNIFKGQGLNILLNIFFGPVVNAARAIAYQVEGAINTLVQNFYTAVRPQIIKSYASGHSEEVNKLINISTRLGYYLMLLFSLIFIFEMQIILSLWLGKIPDYSVDFTRMVLISQLFIVLANPLMTVIHATGKVASYQFWSGVIFIFVLPLSYFVLKLDNDCVYPFCILIISSIMYWILTVYKCKKMINLPLDKYTKMIGRMFVVTFILASGGWWIYHFMVGGYIRFMITILYILIIGILLIYFIDLDINERSCVNNYLNFKLKK